MEDNKLIAEFMELETPDGVYFEYLTKDGERSKLTHFMLLEYHLSWDWLMPVISKCMEVRGSYYIESIYHSLHVQDLSFAHESVVNFIKEHNNGKN